MERLVKCQICGLNIARFGCKMCGKSVCELCFKPNVGVCSNCTRGKQT